MSEEKAAVICILCDKEIAEEEQKWAIDPTNHPGILGAVHKKCYEKACDKEPDLPWRDPLTGMVDYDDMKEDLGVIDGSEEEEDY